MCYTGDRWFYMKKNYTLLKGEEKNYSELEGQRTTKIIPIEKNKETIYLVNEILYVNDYPIYISFYADRLGRAISNIKNSYFDYDAPKELYNEIGSMRYKMYLLHCVQDSLLRKQSNREYNKITR